MADSNIIFHCSIKSLKLNKGLYGKEAFFVLLSEMARNVLISVLVSPQTDCWNTRNNATVHYVSVSENFLPTVSHSLCFLCLSLVVSLFFFFFPSTSDGTLIELSALMKREFFLPTVAKCIIEESLSLQGLYLYINVNETE